MRPLFVTFCFSSLFSGPLPIDHYLLMADPNLIPITDDAHRAARLYLGVTVPLYAIALSTIVARITFKLRSSIRLALDDYLIIIGFVSIFFATYSQ